MKTLVYIASGNYKPEYETLNYDHIYLVDLKENNRFRSDKVIMLQMDALASVEYFKDNDISIDCLVCLCESRGEGGQTYSMCSDAFMGFIMPILSKECIWICNQETYYGFKICHPGGPCSIKKDPEHFSPHPKLRGYYGNNYVSLNLPYSMTEITSDDPDYIHPSLFSSQLGNNNKGLVFRMSYAPGIKSFSITDSLTVRLVQDSIWNHVDTLDQLFISFKLDYYKDSEFFERQDKVRYYKEKDFYSVLKDAREKGFKHIGFTPHYWYQYGIPYQKALERFLMEIDGPMTIDFFYLSSWFHTRFIRKAITTVERSHHHR